MFFAPWCGHCQKFKPEFERAEKRLKGLIDLIAIDCTKEANKPLCDAQGVKGFPTVKLFHGVRRVMDYNGQRTENDLVNFAIANQKKPFVHVPTAASLIKEIENEQDFVVILTPHQKASSTLYSIAKAYSDKKFFVQTEFREKDTDEYKTAAFGKLVESGKMNLIVCTAKVECKKYEGENSADDIKAWLKQ